MPVDAEFHVARLGHEPVDHPVKDHVVIGTLGRERGDPFHVLRRDLFEEVDHDRALRVALHVDLEARGPGRRGQKA